MESFTDREALRQQYLKARDLLIAAPPSDASRYMLRSTSGTSQSAPLHIIFEMDEEVMARFGDCRRVFGAVGTMSVRLLATLFVRYGKTPRQKIFFASVSDIGPDMASLADDFAPDMFYGFLSFNLSVLARMDSRALKSVPNVLVTGEYLTEAQRELLAQGCPRAKILQIYATSETTSASKDFCPYLGVNTYHARRGVAIDIINKDEDGVGDVVLSWNMFRDMRVSRYKIGDSGKIISEPCRCGEGSTLMLMGRSGFDYLKLVGALLRKEEFDRVSGLCRDLIDEYRAEAYSVNQMGKLLGGVELSVYRARGELTETEKLLLAERFSSELFVTPTQTFANLVDKNIFLPLRIKTVAEPFPRTGKDVTLKMRH